MAMAWKVADCCVRALLLQGGGARSPSGGNIDNGAGAACLTLRFVQSMASITRNRLQYLLLARKNFHVDTLFNSTIASYAPKRANYHI